MPTHTSTAVDDDPALAKLSCLTVIEIAGIILKRIKFDVAKKRRVARICKLFKSISGLGIWRARPIKVR